ncbi:MAG: hypothetical protein WCP12_09465 [bacterium]
MNKFAWMLVYALVASSLMGQNTNKFQHTSGSNSPFAFRGRSTETFGSARNNSHANNGFWLERKVTNPDYMKKIGVSEEQAKNLRASWKKIAEQNQKFEEEIHLLANQQAELAKQVLSQSGSDTKNLMALVEKIGVLRIEQAKLAMQRVIVIRDHLTPDQRTKLNVLLEEDQKKWRATREEASRKHENNAEAGQKK